MSTTIMRIHLVISPTFLRIERARVWTPAHRSLLNLKPVNPYLIAMIGTTMIVIQCPHCDEDVELEDGAFRLFDCPHCDEEFEYESSTNSGAVYEISKAGINATLKVGLGLLFGSILAIIIGFTFLNGAINDFGDNAAECESDSDDGRGGGSVPGNPFSLEFWGIDDCSSDGDWGLGSLCCGIILILIGIGVGISAIVSLLTGAVSGNKKVMIIQNGK